MEFPGSCNTLAPCSWLAGARPRHTRCFYGNLCGGTVAITIPTQIPQWVIFWQICPARACSRFPARDTGPTLAEGVVIRQGWAKMPLVLIETDQRNMKEKTNDEEDSVVDHSKR
jgi:hypothetical protein